MALGHDDAAAPSTPPAPRRGAPLRNLASLSFVMPGFMPGIHVLAAKKTWVAGPSPAMTWRGDRASVRRCRAVGRANFVLTARPGFKDQLKHDLQVHGVTVAEISAPREHHDAAEATSVDPWAWPYRYDGRFMRGNGPARDDLGRALVAGAGGHRPHPRRVAAPREHVARPVGPVRPDRRLSKTTPSFRGAPTLLRQSEAALASRRREARTRNPELSAPSWQSLSW
jgi:hypothetical protein